MPFNLSRTAEPNDFINVHNTSTPTLVMSPLAGVIVVFSRPLVVTVSDDDAPV